MTKENKFKIGLALQGIALSMDDITLKANEDRLKMIEDIIAGEQEPCSDAISRQDLLIIKYPFFLSEQAADYLYKRILSQKEKGLVILPAGYEVVYIPNDCEVVIETEGQKNEI